MKAILRGMMLMLCFAVFVPAQAWADGGVCPRPAAQSQVMPPPDIYSVNGQINISMNYYTSVDDLGRTLFCFVTSDGFESPTLHVNPGDKIIINLTNMVPEAPGAPTEKMFAPASACGSTEMTVSSVNMHFHGTNTSPTCHSDEVIHTLINSGETFQYVLKIPKDEPPGLYWYHPHVHGTSSMMLQGGASGAIEVEGIANIQPAVAGLPERYLVLRDQQMAWSQPSLINPPNWDISVNYVPINYPAYQPAVITMQKGASEFWRVVNAGANTIMDLEVLYDGVPQPLQIVAFDGVPTGSKDGKQQGTIITQTDILIPPSRRAEFIVAPPGDGVQMAQLVTLGIDGGAAADNNPARPFANIVTSDAPTHMHRIEQTGPAWKMRFSDLANAKVTAHRDLYFSEYFSQQIHHSPRGAKPPEQEAVSFFITVDGQKETPFDPNNPPAIITTQGAVEEWRIENRTEEVHEFHMHQIHFLVTAINDVPIPKKQQQLYDVFQDGYWDGNYSDSYPSITVKLDFRGPDVGDFVYHCHILQHEDAGMMAIIRVQLPEKSKGTQAAADTTTGNAEPVKLAVR
jgi:FtsP/CotA-like multicopper oxidase with cupredoxin domain